jgi:hypothetical protein
MKTIVYTAIFGDIADTLYRPRQPEDECCDVPSTTFMAFTDQLDKPAKVAGWDMVQVSASQPRIHARRLKVLAHQTLPTDVKYSLWVDGCLTPVELPHLLIDRFLGDVDICVFEHSQRGCVYKELEACLRLKKDSASLMRQQLSRYRSEGYPYDNGLAETTAVLRRHTEDIEFFNKAWWKEIVNGSVRDQLSFNYVAWKLGIRYNTFEGTRVESPHFIWRSHK